LIAWTFYLSALCSIFTKSGFKDIILENVLQCLKVVMGHMVFSVTISGEIK
jgi:hypothetical protein